jgi:Arc/MetJ-type ribon-helix-helix transcriptional regulator
MIECHTMAKQKVAVTLDSKVLERVDALVQQRRFSNRSRVIETALVEKLAQIDRTRLATESAKLDPDEEQSLADEGLTEDISKWPAY